MIKLKQNIIDKYQTEASTLISKLGFIPDFAFVAGSGISDSIPTDNIIAHFKYSDFPFLPDAHVAGHSNELVLYKYYDKYALIFMGRFHLYEGNSLEQICSQTLFSYFCGIPRILLTNAAGGLNPILKPGDLLLINDFINITKFNLSPLFEVPFSDNKRINKKIISQSLLNGLESQLLENGIMPKIGTYLTVTGPYYETRSEIRMMRLMGADAVGMSTYFEAELASLLGMEIAVCSLITNSSKEIKQEVSHKEVTNVAKDNSYKVIKLIESMFEIV